MPTPILKDFRSRLADLNDQACYSYFSDEEAQDSILKASESFPNLFTTASFPNNALSSRINIRNSELPEFRRKAIGMVAATALSAGTEHLLRYIGKVQQFRMLVAPSLADEIVEDKPEDQISKKLEAWGHSLHGALIKTVRYLRLRRNHVAHSNEVPNHSLISLIKSDANYMTTYWSLQPTRLTGMDFSSTSLSCISAQESFSLLNLCLVCMVKIDEAIILSFPEKSLETYESKNFKRDRNDIVGRTPADRYRKFISHFEQTYQMPPDMTEPEFDRVWNEIVSSGVRI